MRPIRFPSAPLIAIMLALSGCATARLHSQDELNRAGATCGLALGELIQDESEKRLLLVLRTAPTDAQRACVAKWAKANRLKVVFVQMSFPEG